jgi:hypothetical protein
MSMMISKRLSAGKKENQHETQKKERHSPTTQLACVQRGVVASSDRRVVDAVVE